MFATVTLLLVQGCTSTDVVGVEVGSITVTPADFSLTEGEDQQFVAVVEDTEGRPIQRADVEWSSDHPEFLSIDAEGMAVAVAEGAATVTAMYGGVTGTAQVTVNAAPAIAVSESEVVIRGATGVQSPAAVVLQVTNGGGGRLGGLGATVQFPAGGPEGWLTAAIADPESQTTTLTLTPQTQTLPLGTYEATVSVTSTTSNVSNSPLAIPVTLTLTNFTIVENGGASSVTEAGSTDDFTIVLDAAPVSDVVMSITSTDTTEVSVSPGEITFTPANWDTPQTVTLTGRDDQIADGDLPVDVTVSVVDSLSDDTYDPIPDKTVTVTVEDDDVASVTVTPTSGVVTTEARGQATFSVRLDTGPTADVTIALTSSDTGEGTVSPASLTFTPADWMTAQTVTVTGVNDEIDDDDVAYTIVTAPATSTDPAFAGLDAPDVSVTNTDDGDTAGITVTPTSGLVTTESGGQATFQVVLDSEPTADVTIALSSGDPTEGTVNPTSITFTPVNWDIARLVTVSSLDDPLPDGDVLYLVTTAAATSSDPKYAGLNASDVTVTNVDDESAGITVSAASGPTTEAGGQATFTVVLNNEPAADVTIGLTSSDTGEGTLSAASLTFTPANWSNQRTITVTGIDDDFDDGDVVYTIVTAAAASTDPNYDGVNAPNVTLANVDDDQAGFLVSSPSGPTTEAGGQSTFTVGLTSEPLADVTIGVSSSDLTEGTVVPPSLTFTPTSWDTPQTVTVTGQNDALADGNVDYTIVTGAAVSSDPGYSGADPADVAMTNVDDEAAGITVSAISGPTTESGGTGTFTVVLNTEPSGPVTVGVASSDTSEGTLAIASLTFAVADWDTPRTVTVTGVDDDLDDGDVAYSIVTTAATSSDPDYDGVDADNVAVTNVDDDSAGFLVSPPSGPTTEAGGQADFTVRLTSQPGSDVTISVGSSDTSEGTVTPTSLTFTTATWSVAQTVTATGQDDDQADGNVLYAVVTGVASSGDTRYDGINPPDVPMTNVDDESAGITVSAISQPTTEDGGQGTFTLVLNAQPSDDVTVGLSSSDATEGTISTPTVVFTPANWDTPQPVTVTGVNDDVDDDNVVYTIVTAPAVSADAGYDGLNPADVLVTNVDDDQAGFLVSPASGPTTEAGGQATFTVRLTSQPTASVTIGVTSGDTSEGTVAPSSVVFSTASWNLAQTVTVTGQNDVQADGNVTYTVVTAPATSTDGRYAGRDPDDVSVTNVDDETAGITVSAISRATTEAGGTGAFTVVLNTQPTAGVSIGISSSDTGEGTVSAPTLSFSTANWDTPQTVTVTGVGDDIDDGDIVYTIGTAAATSGDPAYNGFDPADVSVTNVDDDTAGFLVSSPSGPTTEAGGQATFTVRLTSEPLADVTIALSSTDASEGSVAPASLTFTALDWSSPRTVTVTGEDDALPDGNITYAILTAAATSTDGAYDGLNPADASLTNVDDETAGITVSPTSGPTTELGGTADFTVVLNAQPTAPVTIGLNSSDTSEGTIAIASVTFTDGNWNTPQSVTVSGENDDIDDDNVVYTIVTASATSTDPTYDGINAANVSVTNIDDDVAGFAVSPASGPTTEVGGSATFTIVLTSEPVADVTVGLTSSDGSEGTPDAASVTFTNGDWDVVRTITVTGQDDDVDDGNVAYSIVTGPAVSTDPKYGGLSPADVAFTNVDDEQTGVIVSAVSGPTTEAGGTANFTVRLASQPSASVTIGLSSSDGTEGSVSPASLTFDDVNWSTPQVVIVTGANDDVDDGDIVYAIQTAPAISSDPSYGGVDAADVQVTNNDNDTAGFTVSPASGPTTEAGAGTATFTIALDTQPTADVTVTLTSGDVSEGTVAPGSLTFTTGDWSSARTVTVTGVDDDFDDGNIVYSVLTSASSADPIYDALNPADVSITNVDDDQAGFAISAPSGPTTELNNGTATFTVALTSRPIDGVTIALVSSDLTEGTVAPIGLSFAPAVWNVPQTVTVTGVDDLVADGNVVYSIVTAAAVSTDTDYLGLDPADVLITNVDNETVGITVSPASGPTTEGGGTATFSIVLNTQPTDNVTVGLTSSDTGEGAIVGPSSVTFTDATWSTPQIVTVAGVDDDVDDGNVAYSIVTAPAESGDASYDNLNPADVSVTNVDDDDAGLAVSPISGPTDEAGGQATFTIALTSEPLFNVLVGLTSSDEGEGTVAPTSLTFTPSNWSVTQPVTVTGVNDDIDDDAVLYTIVTAPATSADPAYSGLDGTDVSVTNLDDADAAGITVTPTSGLVTTEAAGTAVFTVVLDSEPLANVTITLSSSDGTEGSPSPTSLTFTPANWDTPRTVTVTGANDAIDDDDVPYTIVTAPATSTDPRYAARDAADVSVTNNDDADTAGIVVTPTSGLTTTEAGGTAQFNVRLTSEPVANVTIGLTSTDASEGTVDSPVTLTAANWTGGVDVTVTGQDDLIDDGDVGYTITTGAASSPDPKYSGMASSDFAVTNQDDDTAELSIDNVSVTEGDGSSVDAVFAVTLSLESTQTVTVQYATSDGSATAGADYTAASGTVVFDPGVTSRPVTVVVQGDLLDEEDETFDVTLSNATGDALIDDALGLGTITDNDPMPQLSIDNVMVTESTGSAVNATFTVTLLAASGRTVTVQYATGNGTATTDGDYVAASGTLTFNPGVTTQPVVVSVTGDALDEDPETFAVNLSGPVNATILDGQGVGTITDDDPEPSLSIDNVSADEGTGAPFNTNFTVTLSPASGRTVTVQYATANASATAPGDYTATSGTLTFLPGVVTQPITVVGLHDLLDEDDETFTVDLSSPSNAGISDSQGVGTINDNDLPPVMSIGDATVTEGNSGTTNATFNISLDAPSGRTLTVNWATSDVSATAGSDYTADSDVLTFAPGVTSQPISVVVTGDFLAENTETFNVTLSGHSNATPGDNTGVGTITNDDVPGFTIVESGGNTTVSEGNPAPGTTDSFTVVLTAEPASNVLLTIVSASTQEVEVQTPTLAFTPGNWSIPQTVTVAGGGSGVDDGDQMTNVTVSVDDAESNNFFDAVPDQIVVVTTIDIDNDGQQDGLDLATLPGGALDRGRTQAEWPADRASVEARTLPWRDLGYSVGGLRQ